MTLDFECDAPGSESVRVVTVQNEDSGGLKIRPPELDTRTAGSQKIRLLEVKKLDFQNPPVRNTCISQPEENLIPENKGVSIPPVREDAETQFPVLSSTGKSAVSAPPVQKPKLEALKIALATLCGWEWPVQRWQNEKLAQAGLALLARRDGEVTPERVLRFAEFRAAAKQRRVTSPLFVAEDWAAFVEWEADNPVVPKIAITQPQSDQADAPKVFKFKMFS